jgi:hypothetical protein
MYSVPSAMWIRVAKQHLDKAAARWFQSIEPGLDFSDWQNFCRLLHDRFDRDQKELLIRHLFHAKQTSSVAAYITQFTELVDQLKAYSQSTDPLFYTMRFIDGLRADIKSIVLVLRPKDLDTACTVALLQEEAGSALQQRPGRSGDWSSTSRLPVTSHSATPFQPPHRPDKPVQAPQASSDAKLTAIKSYRRALGLCFKCGVKWSKDHKCAPEVLHAVEILWDSLDDEDCDSPEVPQQPDEQVCLALSKSASNGSPSSRTIRFQALIAGIPATVLVDSGSSTSFLGTALAAQLPHCTAVGHSSTVQVAGGGMLSSPAVLKSVAWSIDNCKFISDFRVLDLTAFDAIIGMDWLAAFSPMHVDWRQKWLAISYQGQYTLLQGLDVSVPDSVCLQLYSIDQGSSSAVPSLPPEVQHVVDSFSVLFEQPTTLPPSRNCNHTIPLIPGAQPVFIRPYRYPPSMKDEIERQVQDMLSQGLIQPSSSAFASPVLLVKKKDGSFRFCVDFRHLNALTAKSKFPVPIFDQLMDELAHASWFSKLDLRAGFHQILMQPGEEFKTAFQTHLGQYEFRVMAFGLTGAPGTFQSAMNSTLAPGLRRFVIVFFDDILIYSRTLGEHLEHLALVFSWLQADHWKVKLSKCTFAQRSISYLGHIVSEAGVATDPVKVQAITDWPVPTTVRALRGFLGLAGYYRKFVRNFGVIARPLNELLKKDSMFIWTQVHDLAFQTLKSALSSAPVLALPDFTLPFHVETDASGTGVGAVLQQNGHPLAFISKSLSPRNQGLSTYEKEYLAILMAVDAWRHYLLQGEFVIHTDQKSLIHLNEQRLHTPWQQKVFCKLLGLRYKVVYRRGVDNGVADALSRREHADVLLAISSPSYDWLADIQDWYHSDPEASALLSQLSLHSGARPPFSLQQGLIRYKNRIWLGSNASLQKKVISALHDSPVGGHSGAPVTFQKVSKLFFWPGMRASILDYVRHCSTCSQAKPDRSKYPGLLQPLPVPHSAWEIISMDFVEGLPLSGQANAIWVVVDKYSKFAHFIPLRHPFSATTIATMFLDHIYKLHGLPQSIISDRDRIFTSKFWQSLFKMAGIQLRMSSSYHPQTDGQTERVNQCLETFLRCFVHACPSRWVRWLPLAEYWYNTSTHSALGRTPFEVLYGHPPRHLGIDPSAATPVPDLHQWLEERELMQDLVRLHLQRAQERMRRQADKNRSERTFSPGDLVFLKLQPYVQSSVARRAHHKLSFKFFGPFRVLERIGQVAYKLALPEGSAVHPIFHVSQLKSSSGNHTVSTDVPSELTVFQVPEKILQRRWTSGDHPVEQVFIKWSHMPASLATWENATHLREQFPLAPAWGHADSQEGGSVSQLANPEAHAQDRSSSPRPRRPRKPSTRFYGPTWSNN